MATIHIDKVPYTVRDGQNLLQACLSLGFEVPYFCWHPALHSVGSCRQCAVKVFRDEKDTRGRVVMSCMTPAADGTYLSIDDPEARKFRASNIEWLMLNHPHDCPVCDEGGECHLQDMTVMTGHTYRRSRFRKRTHRNQDLGPFVTHEMNRCIQCYRCVRFYRDYAGGRDLQVFACHDHVYFGRHTDGVLESPFAGNLVEICPTGVFTDKTLARHYVRPWDLQTAPSICVHCSLGCNTIPGERYGTLRRIRNRYNGEVNAYFLCDRGRYGYEFVNSERRVRAILRRTDGRGEVTETEETTLAYLASLVGSDKGVIGIGSPRASLEANFALKTLVGPSRFYIGASRKDEELTSLVLRTMMRGGARSPAMRETASADAVLVLGEDVVNSAPVLALNLMQASRQKPMETIKGLNIDYWDDGAVRVATQGVTGGLYIAAPYATDLDRFAARAYRGRSDEIAALGFAVARMMEQRPPAGDLPEALRGVASEIADGLRKARQALIVSGTGCQDGSVIRAAADIAAGLRRTGREAWLSYIVPECNSLGLAMLGGLPLREGFKAAREGRVRTAIVLENDLFRRAEQDQIEEFLSSIGHLVLIDHLHTPTAARAEVLLPAAAWAEADGTLINNEGRAQRFFQVFSPTEPVRESWRWLGNLMVASRHPEGDKFHNYDDVVRALSESASIMAPVIEAAPPGSYRVAGMKVARQHYRYSGRTAMHARTSVHEPIPPDDPDSALRFSMEGYQGQPLSSLIPRLWAPGWNSAQSVYKFQDEVNGPLWGGNPGKRLMEPGTQAEDGDGGMDTDIRLHGAGPEGEGDTFLVVPSYEVFGSEELSSYAPAVARRVPQPYIGMNGADMALAGIEEGEYVRVAIEGVEHTVRVRVKEGMPAGMAALPSGLPGTAALELPTYAKIGKV